MHDYSFILNLNGVPWKNLLVWLVVQTAIWVSLINHHGVLHILTISHRLLKRCVLKGLGLIILTIFMALWKASLSETGMLKKIHCKCAWMRNKTTYRMVWSHSLLMRQGTTEFYYRCFWKSVTHQCSEESEECPGVIMNEWLFKNTCAEYRKMAKMNLFAGKE